MNLKTLVKPELWLAISNTYETANYTHAILDAMHYLSDVLREKSGLDGDGQPLVGRALGGKSPVLRINKLQTETEINVQKGLMQILKGMYQGIRNSRSHEQIEDTKDTADAIIFFINYLLSILDESQEPFTIPSFLSRVLDKHFVRSTRYAELLVSEVPAGKRSDVLIEIYRRKPEGKGANLEYVVKELLKCLSEEEITHFLSVVSDELKMTQEDVDIRLTLQVLPPDLWSHIDEAARLRAENILIKSIQEGQATSDGNTIRGYGTLGIWARDFLDHFTFKPKLRRIILNKLNKDQPNQQYIFHFFLDTLPNLYTTSSHREACLKALVQAVRDDFGGSLKQELSEICWKFPEDWRNSLKNMIPDLIVEEAISF